MSTTVFKVKRAAPNSLVTIQLCQSDTSGNRGVLSSVTVQATADGSWSTELTPNAQVSPKGTFYEIIEPTTAGMPNVHDVLVPVSSSPVRADTLPAPAAGGLPVVTGSKGGNAALTSLMSALSSRGIVVDHTT